MAQSQKDAASDNDVTLAAEETLDFDDDTLRGEKKHLALFYQKISMYKPNKVRIPSPSVSNYTCGALVPPSWIMNTEEGYRVSRHRSLRFVNKKHVKNLSKGQFNKTFTIGF